jgi:hypothetical protein
MVVYFIDMHPPLMTQQTYWRADTGEAAAILPSNFLAS